MWRADQAQADSLEFTEQSAIAARIHFHPSAIFSDLRGRPLSNAELSSRVREVLIADKSALQPVIEALALATTREKAAIGAGLGQAMQAVVSSDSSYATDVLSALAIKRDRIAIAAFVAAARAVMHERAVKDAYAEGAGGRDRSVGHGLPGDNDVSNSFGLAAATIDIAHGNTINPALPPSQARTKPTAQGAPTQNYSVAAVNPAEISQRMEVATPVERALPADASEPAEKVHSREDLDSSESKKKARSTEVAEFAELTATAEAIKPMAMSQPIEIAKPVEMARSVEADRPSATTRAKAEETEWTVSETTSPVDYSPVIGATIWPRQQVNSGLSGLTISCHAKRIALSLRLMGDLDVPRWGEIWIDSQVDDQRRVKQRWTWDEQQGIFLFYAGDPVALLQSIPDGARLRLGVGDNKGARHMATYQLFGLDAVRKKVASACAWLPPVAQASSEKR
jgi:hypothetical protein